MRRKIQLIGTIIIVFIALMGCEKGKDEPDGLIPAMPQEEEPRIPEPPPTETIVKGTATEMDFHLEKYDYAGWEITAFGPEATLLKNSLWRKTADAVLDDDNTHYTSWTDAADEAGSEIVLRSLYREKPFPVEAVMEKATALQEAGIDVEYGNLYNEWSPEKDNEFNGWMKEPYYYRCIEPIDDEDYISEYISSQIFFTAGAVNDKFLCSLSLRIDKDSIGGNDAITMENFFKMTAGFYIGSPAKEYYLEFTGIEMQYDYE